MAYTIIGQNQKANQTFSEEALKHVLRQRFHRRKIISTELLYNRATNADDLNEMLGRLKKHLGIRSRKISAAFSDQIDGPGYCSISKEGSIIYVSSSFAGDAPACAAVIAHNLCHFALIHLHKTIFMDPSENEKAADLAAILNGLGLVVLGGAAGAGWKSLPFAKQLSAKRRKIIGYFSIKSFAQKTSQYLNELHLSPYEVAKNNPAWSNKLLDRGLRYKGPRKTQFMKNTYAGHIGSIRNFWFSVALVSLSSLVIVYVMLQNPLFLNDDLRLQKAKIAELENSYNGCADRVLRREETYGTKDSQILRFIDSERSECKSLQNRYNHAVNVYNQMLIRYKR